jgi:lipid-A-disaccharide synthase
MKIFFSAGEPSGDMHGANLIRELRRRMPSVEAVGYGGPEMADAGCRLHADLTALAVMWIARVVVNLHKFLALAGRADRIFRHDRPDAVVLIDYPGFNWWIARRAKAHGIPVFYFAPPQIWAWAGWRIKKMRRFVDHVLCSLPFEAKWFADRGCRATFVGHPYFDEVRRQKLDQQFLEAQRDPRRPLVTILPGSRTQEVVHNLKYFVRAAQHVLAQVPSARFAIASFKPHHAQLARDAVAGSGLPIEIFVRRTRELIHLSECCMAVSGSVSLELLFETKPTVIQYWVTPFAFTLQRWFRNVKYITLVNLLASDEVFGTDTTAYDPDAPGADSVLFPEYVTCEDKSPQIARHIVGWLTHADARQRLIQQLIKLKAEVGHGGACGVAAGYILDELGRRPVAIPHPHFIPGLVLDHGRAERSSAAAA